MRRVSELESQDFLGLHEIEMQLDAPEIGPSSAEERPQVTDCSRATNSVSVDCRGRRGWLRVGAVAVSAVATLVLMVVNALSIWPNADTSWVWLLVGQTTNRAPRAISLVDGNRVFPDLVFSLFTRGICNLLRINLLGRHFTILYSAAVLAGIAIGILRIHGRSSASLVAFSLFSVVVVADTGVLESLRPGYHAMSAALCILFAARRYRRIGMVYHFGEIALLTLAIASSRFLVVLFVLPLMCTDLALGKFRVSKSHRLFIALGLGVTGWLAYDFIPGVRVDFVNTKPEFRGLYSWLPDYYRSSNFDVKGTASLPVHGALVAAFLACSLLLLIIRRRNFRAIPVKERFLIVLTCFSILIGGMALRVGGYLVGAKGYIFVFPIVMCCLTIPTMLSQLVPKIPKELLVYSATVLVVLFSMVNSRAEATNPIYSITDAHSLLKREKVLGAVGLTDYWTGYGLRSNYGEYPIYNVDNNLRPFFWVVNPWDQWFDRQTGHTDAHRRIGYVLSTMNCQPTDCDSTGFTPRRDAIVDVLGEPDRWVTQGKLRLAVYRNGASSSKEMKLWRQRMDLEKLPYRAVLGND